MTLSKLNHRLSLAGIGLLQGIFIWGLSSNDMAILQSLWFFVCFYGLLLQLAFWEKHPRRLLIIGLIASLVFSGLAFWVWSQPNPGRIAFSGDDLRVATFIAASFISLQIILSFLQVSLEEDKISFPSYSLLFRYSWNNTFIVWVAFIFLGIFVGMISLWALLFNMIGVGFFKDVFFSRAFASIAYPIVFGLGIALGKENDRIINTLRSIALTIFKALMPVLAVIMLLFLAALPFTGLESLWETRYASTLFLFLIGLAILFVNGIYQDGKFEKPYALWFQRVGYAIILTLPVFCGIVFYSIGLRVQQYGITPERFYGIIFAFLSGMYSLGYVVSVFLKRKDGWLHSLGLVNTLLAPVVVLVAMVIHCPALDALSVSADNQYRRLISGKVTAEKFDYRYLGFELGQAGFRRLTELASIESHPEKELIQKNANLILTSVTPEPEEVRDLMQSLLVLTPNRLAPEGLTILLRGQFDDREAYRDCRSDNPCALFPLNIDWDSDEEFGLFMAGYDHTFYVYDQKESGWSLVGEYRQEKNPLKTEVCHQRIEACRNEINRGIVESLKKSDIQKIPPRYSDVQIGEKTFRWHQ